MTAEAAAEGSAESVFVARQPIFDEKQGVWGYELLFRASGDARVSGVGATDADMATAKVIADGFVLAVQGIEPGQRTLINFPQNLILQNFAYALPADIAVVEILEDVRPEPEVLTAIQEFKEAGYTVAMDDFMGEEELEPFLDFVDIIKVDILGILGPEGAQNADKLRPVVQRLGKYNCRLLAEKVEDDDVYSLCKELGFTLFQGFFFAKPQVIPGKKISSNEISKLQLLKELGNPDFKVDKLSEIIQLDPSLSYRLFRYINSVGMGVRQKVESVTRAITLLGQRQLSQWLRVVIMSDLAPSKKGQEVAFMSVHRGRFLELMTAYCDKSHSPETHFLLGLFSMLDAMLGLPMEEVLAQVPLDDSIKAALTGTDNEYRFCLNLVRAYENSDWDGIEKLLADPGIPMDKTDNYYTQAMDWTQGILGFSKHAEA